MSFEEQEEEESEHQFAKARRSVVLGTTTQKKSKKNKKLAITYRSIFLNIKFFVAGMSFTRFTIAEMFLEMSFPKAY